MRTPKTIKISLKGVSSIDKKVLFEFLTDFLIENDIDYHVRELKHILFMCGLV